MYIVYSNGETSTCDAIETITAVNGEIVPVEYNEADGFKALTIVEVSPSEQYYNETLYAFPDHTLDGYDAPTAIYEENELDEEFGDKED